MLSTLMTVACVATPCACVYADWALCARTWKDRIRKSTAIPVTIKVISESDTGPAGRRPRLRILTFSSVPIMGSPLPSESVRTLLRARRVIRYIGYQGRPLVRGERLSEVGADRHLRPPGVGVPQVHRAVIARGRELAA